MKIKDGFLLRKVLEDYILVPVGEQSVDFKSIVRLNETGAFLYGLLEKGFDEPSLLTATLEEYDVTEDIAKADISNFLATLVKAGVVEK